MFFEAGSGQFDDCNAVCMHSGVMRQSLIDVTPFMPVSDFICEYCSCVIIPEEECAAAGETAETKSDEHKTGLKKEQQKKLQLDDETLMLARDVRALRERRRQLEEELANVWTMQEEAMTQRQQTEALRDRLEWSQRLESMSRDEVERTRATLIEKVDAAKKSRAQAQAQIAARQERLAKRDAAATSSDADLGVELPQVPPRMGLGRRLSFSRKKKQQQQQQQQQQQPGDANGGGGAANGGGSDRHSGEAAAAPPPKKESTLTRVLSFGRSKKSAPSGDGSAEPPSGSTTPRGGVTGALVRKLSFGKKRQT